MTLISTMFGCKLQRQLPFPHGVILPQEGLTAAAFNVLDQQAQNHITTKCPSGQLLDGLIMFVRALMVFGFDAPDRSADGDPRLYDIAAHHWGHRRFNDFAMKGHLFTLLRDMVDGGEDYNPSMPDLLRHPLVVATIWEHPRLCFFQRSTSVHDPDTDTWMAAEPDFLSVAEQAARIPFLPGPTVDLGTYFSAKMGAIVNSGRRFDRGPVGVRPGLYTGATFNPICTMGGEYVDPRKVGSLYTPNPSQARNVDNPMHFYTVWSDAGSQSSGNSVAANMGSVRSSGSPGTGSQSSGNTVAANMGSDYSSGSH
ncbi:hypothetical protein QBC39DRAFT_430049 [Podospora conica]|nr:hypothetical protein QBC39DRAFT_430049 [Schizothecium conicum]